MTQTPVFTGNIGDTLPDNNTHSMTFVVDETTGAAITIAAPTQQQVDDLFDTYFGDTQ